MYYYPAADIWFYLLAAAVDEALAVYLWRYRNAPAALALSFTFALRSVWLAALVMVSASSSVTDKLFWITLQHMCIIAIVPLFLMAVLHITGQKSSATHRIQQVLLTLTLFSWLALLTNRWHGWLWRDAFGEGTVFVILREPLYWIMAVSGYALVFSAILLLIRWSRRITGLRRFQAWALAVGPLLLMAGHYWWFTGRQIASISPLPLAFLLSGLLWGWILFRLRVFNLMELAETAVARNMNDSLIVIDSEDNIVELNPAARRLFALQPTLTAGAKFAAACSGWPALLDIASAGGTVMGEVDLPDVASSGHYRVHVTPLIAWGKNFGQAIVLHDISDQKKAQAQILEQQKALSIMTERQRLGRELHDGAGQIWGYLNLQYQSMRKLLAGKQIAEVDARLEKLIAITGDFHTDVRDSIAGLKTAAIGKGFRQTLTEYVQWYEKSYGIAARFTGLPSERIACLSAAGEMQLLRIIQEAMANTRKYSQASLLQITFQTAGDQLAVTIEDNGCGFDLASVDKENHHGLDIMRERAGEIGGRLEIQSAPGVGTKLALWLPAGSQR